MSDSGLASLFAALADDLEQLARLHRCEIDAATVGLLKSEKFPSGLALQPEPASEHMAAAVEFLPTDPAGLDRRDDVPPVAAYSGADDAGGQQDRPGDPPQRDDGARQQHVAPQAVLRQRVEAASRPVVHRRLE